MASKNFKGRIKHTRDTSANWEAKNPVLLAGEVILVDTAAGELRSKTGDGSKRYKQLPFDDEVIRNLINDSKYIHPSHNAASSGLYKITVDALGHVSATTAVTKADITGLGIPGQDTNTTYSAATSSVDGLMSKEDKDKLDGIASGANNYTHPANHAATMITQDDTHRFVTDTEKTTWNGKANASDLTAHTGNTSNPHSVTKNQVGLGNVTNDAQVKRTEMGAASGVATLDASGKVPSSQLPSYVDDVIEGANVSAFPSTGESGKIYVDLSTNKTYRWSGTTYVVISETIALGETSSTAYAGNKGKANADAIATMQTKLNGIANGAEVNVQSDWSATSGDAFIKNKPTKLSQFTNDSGFLTSHQDISGKANLTQVVRYDAAQSLTSAQKTQARTNIGAGTSSFDGNYNSLSGKPTIPTKTSQLTNDSGFLTQHQDISGLAPKSDYLPLTGGTLSGNLTVGQAKVQSNGYVVGTWLQATAANALTTKPPRICVQDSSGWIYSRTPDQILGDIGATKVQLVTWEATD